MFGGDNRPSHSTASDQATALPVRYIHQTVNIRSGPGTTFEVVGQAKRGDTVRIKGAEGDWSQVAAPGQGSRFIYTKLLQAQPIPPIEIASWNWRSDRDFTSGGAVIWNVELRNNTPQYIEYVRVAFTTYDSGGQLITSDSAM